MAFYVENITPFRYNFSPSWKSLKKTQDYYNVYNAFSKTPDIANSVVAYAKGRMYYLPFAEDMRSVIDVPQDELIETAPHIIESIMRNEVLAEVDLWASEVDEIPATYTRIKFNGTYGKLISDVDDYYNDCYLINITRSWIAKVLDYEASTKAIYVDIANFAEQTDKFKIVNIRHSAIDFASFDIVGGAVYGTRKDWLFAKSINAIDTFGNVIQPLLFESFIIPLKSHKSYKVATIFEDSASVGTFSNPMYDYSTGLPQISYGFTNVENLYNDFEINYGYEYGREEYRGKVLIKDTYAKQIGSETFSTEIGLCSDVLSKYRRTKKYKYDSSWIQDDDTAILFAKKVVNLYTKQRIIVSYTGDIKNHIKYEIGDVVLINYPKVLPTNKNNSAKFQIMEKTINLAKGQGFVNFTLIEV